MKDKDKIKIRDENIIDKIAHPEQLSGLLNAFLDGLDRLVNNGKFSSTKGTEEIKNLWIRKSDSFQAFCMDMIEEQYDSFVTVKSLKSKFSRYCREHKLKSVSDRAMNMTMETMFGANKKYKRLSEIVS